MRSDARKHWDAKMTSELKQTPWTPTRPPLRGCEKIGTGTFATTDFQGFSPFRLGASPIFSQPLIAVWAVLFGCLLLVAGLSQPLRAAPPDEAAQSDAKPEAKPGEAAKEVVLFDGKTLKGWKILDKIDFDRHGEVKVKDGELILETGQFMTGIKWEGEFPKLDYEVTFEARRIDGYDFFCGMTFPVADSHASLILGGWGGTLTGISSIDGFDASENETTGTKDFENKKWYKVRLRVTKEKIEAWIDDGKKDDKIVDVKHAGRKVSVRWEMDTMPPFGFATYNTTGGLKNLKLKRL
jgi:hypothetical protein